MIIAKKYNIRMKIELMGGQVIFTFPNSSKEPVFAGLEYLRCEAELFLNKQGYMPYPVLVLQSWLVDHGWEIIKPVKIVDIDYPDNVVF
jgi:hypothetical protein